MVARLEWEQRDRMSLLAQQRELEQHVEGMRAANLARKNTLDSLPESLTALRTVCHQWAKKHAYIHCWATLTLLGPPGCRAGQRSPACGS